MLTNILQEPLRISKAVAVRPVESYIEHDFWQSQPSEDVSKHHTHRELTLNMSRWAHFEDSQSAQ